MNLFQIVFLIFISISLYRVVIKIKTGQLSIRESFIWIFVWVLGAVIIFDPGLSIKISNVFGIGRGVDLVIYTSVIFLYYLVYKIYVKLESIQKKIKEIATKIAIKNEKDSTSLI